MQKVMYVAREFVSTADHRFPVNPFFLDVFSCFLSQTPRLFFSVEHVGCLQVDGVVGTRLFGNIPSQLVSRSPRSP